MVGGVFYLMGLHNYNRSYVGSFWANSLWSKRVPIGILLKDRTAHRDISVPHTPLSIEYKAALMWLNGQAFICLFLLVLLGGPIISGITL